MKEIVNIDGKEIERIYYKNKPVVTFKIIDELHHRPEGTARKTFNTKSQLKFSFVSIAAKQPTPPCPPQGGICRNSLLEGGQGGVHKRLGITDIKSGLLKMKIILMFLMKNGQKFCASL